MHLPRLAQMTQQPAFLYNPTAASRAWTAIHNFLDEIFSGK